MTILERFKLELSNKEYYSDDEYKVFLQENELNATDTYDKKTMQRNLLLSIVNVLETLCNDTDLMRKIDAKDIQSTTEAVKWLRMRIEDIKQKISTIPNDEEEEEYSNIKLLFTRRR
ncbi:hypothetical protein CLOACE_18770 [Clostridium acetireducens DSM 10703]|uniref:Uncharacterized protein n=1 Tax=Clostridium acetireducens DSM 10703 TaxID=1121290 RepID=A0A1E8EWV9_9CLOT|nr:hypothetical protein [Clostridium acetireducens]OFI05259.1 hypothetical protein CLOACE_18770 [Clostridium acetireducens DSM 10703]